MSDGDRVVAELELSTLFQTHFDRPWIFVRPGGNWGDHLIYAGAEKLATRLGLQWVTQDASSFPAAATSPEHCIYLHGGGGYNSWGSGRPFQVLAAAVGRNVHLVAQGPQTLEGAAESLRNRFVEVLQQVRSRRIVFFAREAVSRQALETLRLPAVELAVDHDTAFHLEPSDILRLAAMERVPAGRYDMTAYREDDEHVSGTGGTPARGVVIDPAYVAESFEQWLRIHLFARSVLTNRLHSGIVAALVGKPVTLACGSYHKNRSIWEYSLARRGVCWTDRISAADCVWDRLPARMRESYKLQKLRLMWQRVPVR